MEHQKTITKRRTFLRQSLAFALSLPAIQAMAIERGLENGSTKEAEALPAELVRQFVIAAHNDLGRVKEMLAKEPMLANACWDWGGGDFEQAIGGPAHMGNRDIANYLLDNNARIDIFCAAMLGESMVVGSLIKMKSDIVNVLGPHQFPLLYHVAISGNIDMAIMVRSHLDRERIAMDCNRALQSAARGGHAAMIEWLFTNGADNPNIKDIMGKTALQIAEERGHKNAVMVLKKYGG